MASLKSLLTPIFLTVLSCWCLENSGPQLSHAQIINTIKPGEVLGYSSQLLVSADGKFQLGFFNNSPDGGYLGIWYTNDAYNSKVWVANRDTPVQISKGNLTMDADGLLKIVHDGGNPIPLNANETAPNSTATLENTGNFIVKELNSDGSTKRVLWQSFDHPTDTLLPGMKLGINLKTQQKWMLTSWLTDQIPAKGGFSLEWDLTANGTEELVMRHRGNMYWVSGVGRNYSDFENVGTMTADGLYYNFNNVSNENERYFNYSLPGRSVSRWVLTSDGQLTDNPKPIFVRSGMCFGYSSDPGCVKPSATNCRNSNQKFDSKRGYFPSSPQLEYNSSISIGDCWAQCWSNCSCVGFDKIPNNETGCRFYINSQFVANDNNDFCHILIETEEPNREKTWWIWIIVTTMAASVVVLGFLCFLRRKKLQWEQESNEEATLLELTASNRFGDANENSNDGKKGHDLKVFRFASIVAATDNFSTENKLGQGGFGPVYKIQRKRSFWIGSDVTTSLKALLKGFFICIDTLD